MIAHNKVPKSDKVKLSHPLLAQRLRQLHFAPGNGVTSLKENCDMEDPYKIFRVLIKFMDEKYVDSFLNEGLLFMNNIFF